MRMLLLCVLLLMPTRLYAENPCFGLDNDTCKNTGGCYWENECMQCGNGDYCPQGYEQAQPCPAPYNNSELGSVSANDCYISIECHREDDTINTNCGHYHNNTYKCKQDNGTYVAVHMENDECYYNVRYCRLFDNDGCDTFMDDDSGTPQAHWQPSEGPWYVNNCICSEGNFTDTSDRHCNGTHSYIKPESATAVSATSEVKYNQYAENVLGPNGSSYHCKSCQNGYYVSNIYQSSNPADFPYCKKPGAASIVVCNCEEIPKGWYGTENCNWNADTLSSSSNLCPKNPCPAGQTTSGTGATSAEQCQYTSETQFCDSKGCFQFGNDFENWDLHI